MMSSSAVTTKQFTFSHIWTIEQFTKYCATLNYPSLQSTMFFSSEKNPKLPKSIEARQFVLSVHPKGINLESAEFVSIFLRLANNQTNDCSVMYEFSVIDAVKKKRNQTQYIDNLNRGHAGLGSTKWIARADLINPENGYLKDGNLTICCEVSILTQELDTENGFNMSENEISTSGKAQLCENISNLWKMRDELPGDLEIQVTGGKVLSAHKVILASRCPVFGAMFRHKNTKESIENRINFPDMSAEVCTAFLEYLYTGTVSSLVEQAESLLPVADKYQMDHLKSIVERTLFAQISNETVYRLYNLAERHNADELRQRAVDFIKIKAQESLKNIVDNEKMAVEADHLLADLKNRNA